LLLKVLAKNSYILFYGEMGLVTDARGVVPDVTFE
jgi:hypothetical protein